MPSTKFLEMVNKDSGRTPEQINLQELIHKHIREKGPIRFVEGALGDVEGCGAYVETVNDLGTKFYGIKHIFRGNLDSEVIDKVAQVKRTFIQTAKLVTSFPFVILLPFFILFKTRSKNLIIDWVSMIYASDLMKEEPQEFCPPVEEFLRIGRFFVRKPIHEVFLKCLAMFLEYDNAYRFQFQDAFGDSLNIHDAIKTLLERQAGARLGPKYKTLRTLIRIMSLSGEYRRFFRDIFILMNRDKIRPDENDWYFMLNRKGYNFGGFTYEERLKMKKEIDIKEGNIVLNI